MIMKYKDKEALIDLLSEYRSFVVENGDHNDERRLNDKAAVWIANLAGGTDEALRRGLL